MSKIIEINNCRQCPNCRPDVGKFFCSHPNIKPPKQIDADYTKDIPEWCPLEEAADFAESNFDIDRDPNA